MDKRGISAIVAFVKGTHDTITPIFFWRDDAVNLGSQTGNLNAMSALVRDGDTMAWTASPSDSLNDMDWHHVLLTFTANVAEGLKIYVDGVNVNSASTIGVDLVEPTTNVVTIGSPTSGSSNNQLNGSIDDVMVYDRVLSEEEIGAIYEVQGTGQA